MSTKSLECVCRISGMVAFATLGAFGGSAETVALRAFETGRTHVTETATLDRATSDRHLHTSCLFCYTLAERHGKVHFFVGMKKKRNAEQ